jgi:hypothetical protein
MTSEHFKLMKKLAYRDIRSMQQTINVLEECAIINEYTTTKELAKLCQEFGEMVVSEYESQRGHTLNEFDFNFKECKEKVNGNKRLQEWR